MVRTILATIPIGLGIALNPIAIVAGLLILRTAHARRNGIAFFMGWVLGLALLTILGSRLFQLQAASPLAVGLPDIVWVAIGTGLLISALLRVVRGRPLPGEEPPLPRWLGLLDQAGVARSAGIGLFLAAVSLRNLALLTAVSSVIGAAGLGWVERGIVIAGFVAVASLGILAPLCVALLSGERADATLARWGDWLTRNVGTITAVVLAAVGLYLLVQGISGLS